MAEVANLRDIRVQYLVLDDTPAKLRDVRLQSLEESTSPASVRRMLAQTMVTAKDPANLRDVRLQTLEEAALPAAVRRLTTQVLVRPRNSANLASMRVQYLEIDNSHPNFRLNAWSRLLTIINRNNGWNFTPDMLTPATPEVNSDKPQYWNTRLKVTAQPVSGFSGSMYVYYQRYPINTRFKEIGHPVLNLAGKTSVKDVLPELNAWFDMALTLDDVLDTPIANNHFELVATDHSWFFLPGTRFSFYNVSDLKTLYPSDKLRGFSGAIKPGGALVEPNSPSGIYQVMLDDGTLTNAYVDMTTDGGYWIQVADWTGASGADNKTMTYNDTLVSGNLLHGSTTNATTSPVVTADRLTNNAKEWMFNYANPEWIALFGAWQVGKMLPPGKAIGPYDAIGVRTPLGNRNLYGPRAGWNTNTELTNPFGFWTTNSNGGPCGGANRAGASRICPIYDNNGYYNHCDYTHRKRYFVRATNYIA